LLFNCLAVYVDPGSGSMILQLLLGGVSGVYVIFRLFKQKLLGVFGIRPEGAESEMQAIPHEEGEIGRQV